MRVDRRQCRRGAHALLLLPAGLFLRLLPLPYGLVVAPDELDPFAEDVVQGIAHEFSMVVADIVANVFGGYTDREPLPFVIHKSKRAKPRCKLTGR